VTLKQIKMFFYAADDPDLKAGVTSLARLLNLPEHHDQFVLLQVNIASCIVIDTVSDKTQPSPVFEPSCTLQ
jgi:hypothetical protein